MQTSSEDFTVNAVCTMLPFVLKYEDLGPLEKSSGTALLYLYDKSYAYEYVILCYTAWHRVRLVGPGTCRLEL